MLFERVVKMTQNEEIVDQQILDLEMEDENQDESESHEENSGSKKAVQTQEIEHKIEQDLAMEIQQHRLELDKSTLQQNFYSGTDVSRFVSLNQYTPNGQFNQFQNKNLGMHGPELCSNGFDNQSAQSENVLLSARSRNKNKEMEAKIQKSKAQLLEQLKTFKDPNMIVIDCKNKSQFL